MTKPNRKKSSFETEIDIEAPRNAVWQAITDPRELMRWFAPNAETDLQIGGEIVWDWGAHHRWPQRIEILEPGRRLRTRGDSQVDDGEGGKKPLWIDFLLEGDGGTTTLRLVQSGFGEESGFDEEYDGISRGWPVELRSLRLYLEQHRGQDRQRVWAVCSVDMDADEAWRLLAGDRGLACGTAVDASREGEPFSITTSDGDVFSGRTLRCHPREFSGNAESHGDAFFRVSVDRWGGKSQVWCWLGAYGQDQADIDALQRRWDAMLERLFATNGETVS